MFYVVYDEDVEHTTFYAYTHTFTHHFWLGDLLWSFGLNVHEEAERKRGIEICRGSRVPTYRNCTVFATPCF